MKYSKLETGDGRGLIEFESVEHQTLFKIKTQYWSNSSDSLFSETSVILPIAHEVFLENFRQALNSVQQHIIENSSSYLKVTLLKESLFLELGNDSGLIQTIGKRWCAVVLSDNQRLEIKYAIQLDLTVIDTFLEHLEREEKLK